MALAGHPGLEEIKVNDNPNSGNEAPVGSTRSVDASDALVHDSVRTALHLGWWIADAFNFSKPARLLHPDLEQGVPEGLSDLSKVQPRDRLRMYIDGVEIRLRDLARMVPDGRNVPSAEAARVALKALRAEDKDAADHLLTALNRLHVDVLTWLLATDLRLGTAYRVGRSLFETTRNQEVHLDKLRNRFDERIIQICKWLEQLAAALPPYSAKVVRHSVALWTNEIRNVSKRPDSDETLKQLARRLHEQGDIWLSLLGGDLDGRVLLISNDYADIAERLALDNRRLVGLLTRRILFTRPAKESAARAEAPDNLAIIPSIGPTPTTSPGPTGMIADGIKWPRFKRPVRGTNPTVGPIQSAAGIEPGVTSRTQDFEAPIVLNGHTSRRHGLPLIIYITLAVAAILIVGVFAATGSPTVRVAATLVTVAGGVLSIWRLVSQPLSAAMRTVNRPLYDAQVTVHVAHRISWPLYNAIRRN
jgi:hypothetical protein